MASTSQARKRARQSERARRRNVALRSSFRTAIKKVIKAIQTGDKEVATRVFRRSISVMDSIADKGIFHKNKAARHKSRLNKKIKSMESIQSV